MAELLTRTKVVLPHRRKDLFSRQRLINLLYDLLDEKLILVIAPAGYGKTSLLVDFSHQLDMPVCWYALDELDQTPLRFYAYFIASLRQRFSTFGDSSLAALAAINQFNPDISQLVAVIVNDAYEHIQEHFLIVLDDYHLVSGVKEIQAFVSRFINEAAENCHLILASRTLLSLPDLPLLVARSQVGGIGYEELAFRPQEIQSLALQNYHLTLSASAAQDLAQETEGWITGLLLSSQALLHGTANQIRAARVSGIGLYNYLAQEILDQQTPVIRDFLLRTSFLDEFDASLCEAVWGGSENWPALIESLVQNNLFVLPVGESGRSLRYHHLFRDFLQMQFGKESPGEVGHLLHRIASVYMTQEEWARAYLIYQRLGDVSAIADLVEQAGSWLIRNSQFAVLANWIDSLPSKVLASRPGLISHKGVVLLFQGQVENSRGYLDQAEQAQRAANDHAGLARTLARRASAQRYLGNYQASINDGQESLALSADDDQAVSVKADAYRAIGMSLYHIGQLNGAIGSLNQSLALYQSIRDLQNTALVHMELGICCQYQGSTRQAMAHNEEALSFWKEVRNTTRQSFVLNNLGGLHHLSGNYLEATKLYEEALTLARSYGISRSEGYLLFNIGNLYTDLEAYHSAKDVYQKTKEICQRLDDHFLLFNLQLAEAALARRMTNYPQACAYLLNARDLVHKSHSNFEKGLWAMEAGRLYLSEAKSKDAVRYLTDAVQLFTEGGQKLEAACASLLLTRALYLLGQPLEAQAAINQAFGLVANLDSIQPLVMVGRELKDLLQAKLEDAEIGPQVLQLLNQVETFEGQIAPLRRRLRPHATTVFFVPPKLSISALGRSRVKIDGKPVTAASWINQKRARELFFYLLAHPKGMTKEEIGITLWPDSSPEKLKLQFRNTVYRLRCALGQETVIFDDYHYSFNTDLDFMYDVQDFERGIQQAQAAEQPEEKIDHLQTAIQFYQGPFFPEGDGTWVLAERQRLSRQYLDALLSLTQLYLERGDARSALATCQRIIEEDRCQEAAHRLAMQAYAALGDRAGIIRQYDDCRQALSEDLATEPSGETARLYQMLRK